MGCASSKQMVWQESKYEEIVKMINSDETFYAFFKRDDCPHCPPFEKILQDVASTKNLSIYVVDTSLMSESEKEEYIKEFDVQYVPVIYDIQEGEIVDSMVGDVTREDLNYFTE